MVLHKDGMWELDLVYTTQPTGFTPMSHIATIDLKVLDLDTIGLEFDDIDVVRRNSVIVTLTTVANEFFELIQPLFPASTSFSKWELYQIPEDSNVKTLYSEMEIGDVGTAVEESVPAHQTTLTFRTVAGNWGKFQLMETANANRGSEPPPYTYAPNAALAAFIKGAATPFIGRDGEFFWANMHDSETDNEKLSKIRYPR